MKLILTWLGGVQDEHKVFVDLIKNAETLFPKLSTIPHVMGHTRVAWDNHRIMRSAVSVHHRATLCCNVGCLGCFFSTGTMAFTYM